MSSSSSDDYRMYRRMFPVHDAAESGDREALIRMLRPRKADARLGSPAISDGGTAGDGVNSGNKVGHKGRKHSVPVNVSDVSGQKLLRRKPLR